MPLFYQDVNRIAAYTNLSIKEFVVKHCDSELHNVAIEGQKISIPLIALKTSKNCCGFYKNNECSIHKVKPYFCEAAPFISLLFQNDDVIEFHKNNCHGFGHGIYYSNKKIESILLQEIELEEKEWFLYNTTTHNELIDLINDQGGNYGRNSGRP